MLDSEDESRIKSNEDERKNRGEKKEIVWIAKFDKQTVWDENKRSITWGKKTKKKGRERAKKNKEKRSQTRKIQKWLAG